MIALLSMLMLLPAAWTVSSSLQTRSFTGNHSGVSLEGAGQLTRAPLLSGTVEANGSAVVVNGSLESFLGIERGYFSGRFDGTLNGSATAVVAGKELIVRENGSVRIPGENKTLSSLPTEARGQKFEWKLRPGGHLGGQFDGDIRTIEPYPMVSAVFSLAAVTLWVSRKVKHSEKSDNLGQLHLLILTGFAVYLAAAGLALDAYGSQANGLMRNLENLHAFLAPLLFVPMMGGLWWGGQELAQWVADWRGSRLGPGGRDYTIESFHDSSRVILWLSTGLLLLLLAVDSLFLVYAASLPVWPSVDIAPLIAATYLAGLPLLALVFVIGCFLLLIPGIHVFTLLYSSPPEPIEDQVRAAGKRKLERAREGSEPWSPLLRGGVLATAVVMTLALIMETCGLSASETVSVSLPGILVLTCGLGVWMFSHSLDDLMEVGLLDESTLETSIRYLRKEWALEAAGTALLLAFFALAIVVVIETLQFVQVGHSVIPADGSLADPFYQFFVQNAVGLIGIGVAVPLLAFVTVLGPMLSIRFGWVHHFGSFVALAVAFLPAGASVFGFSDLAVHCKLPSVLMGGVAAWLFNEGGRKVRAVVETRD